MKKVKENILKLISVIFVTTFSYFVYIFLGNISLNIHAVYFFIYTFWKSDT